jgi:superfamily I DNA and/or RNA helicase
VREASAGQIVEQVREALNHVPPGEVLILTPFLAQVRLIHEQLRAAGLPRVSVSTVHRAQGGERLVVFFDPVLGRSAFLRGEAGARLINVALSRAQARLVLFLAEDDKSNPHFAINFG